MKFSLAATSALLLTTLATLARAGSQAVAAQAVDFVFARILGIFGLYWVIAFGHTWVNNDSTPKADVEQQQDASPAPQAAADNTKTEVSEHN